MATSHAQETQEIDERSPPWSLVSELLGHYDTESSIGDSSPPDYGQRASMSSGAINVFGVSAPSRPQPQVYPNMSSQSPSFNVPAIEACNNYPEQRPLIRASTTFRDRVITDWWWWELFSWLVSFCSFSAIVGVLLYYDGKRQPEHVVPGLTLNALIAVLAAIAKSALIVPVSEAIGQLKWIWFKRKESILWDFYTFDIASRGPWGSLMLLGTTKCRHLVSLGAIITVLAVGFEPFFQQIVSFPRREVVLGESSISVAVNYNPIDDLEYSSGRSETMSSLSLEVGDIVRSRNTRVKPPPSKCPTGKCTWPPYTSLGVCHTCEDVSRLLSPICRKGRTRSFTNPCGFEMNNTLLVGTYGYKRQETLGLTTFRVGTKLATLLTDGVHNEWNSTAFPDALNSIYDLYIAFMPGGEPEIHRNATPVMMECLFHWCVKVFEASYQDGVLQENVKTVYSANAPLVTNRNSTEPPIDLTLQYNDPFVLVAEGKKFQIGANRTIRLSKAIAAHMPQFMTYTDSTGQYPGRWNFVQTPPYNIHSVLGPIAEALTNNMRASINNGTQTRFGNAWGSENFVETQWLWITLPAILLLGTLLLMCSTILQSRRENAPCWKSSALATLLHGLTEEGRQQFGTNLSQSEVEAVSQKLRVKLLAREGNERLVEV